MRKIFIMLAGLIAAAGLSSCTLEKEGNYVYGLDYYIYLSDEDKDKREADAKLVEEYLKMRFVTTENTGSYFGYSYDARVAAQTLFENVNKSLTAIDVQYLLSFIDDGNDFIQVFCTLSGPKLQETVGIFTWADGTREEWEEAFHLAGAGSGKDND